MATAAGKKHPNNIARYLRGKSIAQVARDLGIAERTLRGWVGGEVRVPQHTVEMLSTYLGCSGEQLLTRHVVPVGNIPYQRNALFTGRDELLKRLHHALTKNSLVAVAQPQALCGLGGIGKTQTVIEYAYRYCSDYDVVLWIKADTSENVLSDMLHIATLLELPERGAQDPAVTVAAVQRWLQVHGDWLLIFDNADDLTVVRDVLPATYQGHILLTTRAQAMGRLAYRFDIEEMNQETGALFVLRRSGRVSPEGALEDASEADLVAAMELVRELGGLPLALDQAGAYMEECHCGIDEYLQHYRKERHALLARRGGIVDDHPEPVATTWSISFAEVEATFSAAADLLRGCAFLDPDAISEELILNGAEALGPALAGIADEPLKLREAIAALWKYSLIRRNIEKRTLSLHRLVQVVVRDALDLSTQRLWAERIIRALTLAFPSEITLAMWPQCQQLLSHVALAASYVEQYGILFPEAASLFNQAGYYLRERALYKEAEGFYTLALSIRERALQRDHPALAQSLYNLARVYFELGQYDKAEELNVRALEIRERALPPDHLDIALSLNNLAFLYYLWGVKWEQAECFFQRALPIFEKAVGLEHPRTAHCLSNLALFYAGSGRYEEAEQLLLQVLASRERLLGRKHLDTARSLQNLAWLYIEEGRRERYTEAKSLLEESLLIRKEIVGEEHSQTANSLHHLAMLEEAWGHYEEAEQLYLNVLGIRRKVFGENNPKTRRTEACYASLLQKMGRATEAAQLGHVL